MLKLRIDSNYMERMPRCMPTTRNEAVWFAIQHWCRMVTYSECYDDTSRVRDDEIYYFRKEFGESWCGGDCILCQIDWEEDGFRGCDDCPFCHDKCLRNNSSYEHVCRARTWRDWRKAANNLINSLYKAFNVEYTVA